MNNDDDDNDDIWQVKKMRMEKQIRGFVYGILKKISLLCT